jgi:transposase-like protein
MPFPNRHPQKYLILQRMATDPDMSAAEAARTFGVNKHTVSIWCREAGIPLGQNKHPRVGRILAMKQSKRKRLIRELAVIEREIQALQELDPSAPYIKPKKKKGQK